MKTLNIQDKIKLNLTLRRVILKYGFRTPSQLLASCIVKALDDAGFLIIKKGDE